jgi:hypothetical protein
MNQTIVKAIVRQNFPDVIKQSHRSTPEVETLIKSETAVVGKSSRSSLVLLSTAICKKKKKRKKKKEKKKMK